MTKDKAEKRRKREMKLKHEKMYQEQKSATGSSVSKTEVSLKIYLMVAIVFATAFFVFYNMR